MTYSRTEIRAEGTSRGVVITEQDGIFRAAFGYWSKDDEVRFGEALRTAAADYFRGRPYDCERKYKTEKAARKAAADWMAT